MDVNLSLYDQYIRSYRQFTVPITAELSVNNTPVNGNVQGSTGAVQMPGDIFKARKIAVYAIDAAGTRMTPETQFDQILIDIKDTNSGFTFTNGNIDLLTFWNLGLQVDWEWTFYQQQQLTVNFTLDQVATPVAVLPIRVGFILTGERYGNPDFSAEIARIRERAYIT